MHILVLLGVVAGVFLWATRQRPARVPPTELSALDLREVVEAIDELRAVDSDCDAQTLWALCFLAGDPVLDTGKISQQLRRRWKIESATSAGRFPYQRVIRFGEAELTLEPLAIAGADSISSPSERIDSVAIPVTSSGAVFVTATSAMGGGLGSLALSQAVLSLVKTCPQIQSVYWMSSAQLFSRSQILKRLSVNFRKVWPVDLWVSTRARQSGDGTSTGYTVGLAAMGGTEFEAPSKDSFWSN